MTYDSTLFNPAVCLEITAPVPLVTQGWNAYLNQLCVDAVLPWLQEDYFPQTTVFPNRRALSSFWELVNGTALTLGDRRLILIPTESIDLDELRVPQEWVDIPSWAGDYYLVVQMNPDDGWVRLGGVATHRQLKAGRYEVSDRTYCLDESDLIPDWSALWVAQRLNPTEVVRAELGAIAPLPLAQAENLLQRLGRADMVNPRLGVPFAQWAGLISHGGWRQRLAELRWGREAGRSPLMWLRSGVSEWGRALGWSQTLGLAGARGAASDSTEGILSRSLTIQDQSYELRVFPLDLTANHWRFELRNPTGMIPTGFKLRLLTEDLQGFEGNEDGALTEVELLFIEVGLEAGEAIVWEVEPIPQGYEAEILRF